MLPLELNIQSCSLTIYCTESIRDFGVDRVVIVWCETMYRKLENPG